MRSSAVARIVTRQLLDYLEATGRGKPTMPPAVLLHEAQHIRVGLGPPPVENRQHLDGPLPMSVFHHVLARQRNRAMLLHDEFRFAAPRRNPVGELRRVRYGRRESNNRNSRR